MINFLKKHWLVVLAVLYFIFPIDLIPDIAFPVGFIDDTTLMGLGIVREIVLAVINANKKKSEEKKKVIMDGEEV